MTSTHELATRSRLDLQGARLDPLANRAAGTLVVHEIYRSLQGESTFAGLPCVFVRLTACHLRCTYCDTAHAFYKGTTLSVAEVVCQVLSFGGELVEITGGEPLLQADVHPLMNQLADAGKTVLLETSGAVETSAVDSRVRIILDLKTPGSGEDGRNLPQNWQWLRPTDELKVVVTDREDFDWAVALILRENLIKLCPILISPVHGRVEPRDLAAWVLESGLPLRLQIQLHKLLWGPTAQGV